MSYQNKLLCQRAGWDYEQVMVEQTVLRRAAWSAGRAKLTGYGIYFSGPVQQLADFSDLLSEKIDTWNARATDGIRFDRCSFEGWAIGELLEEFVYFKHPARPITVHTITAPPASVASDAPAAREAGPRRLRIVETYEPAPDQMDMLDQFIAGLHPAATNPALSMRIGALQINHFG